MQNLDHNLRLELIINILHCVYKSTDAMLNKTLFEIAKHNGQLKSCPGSRAFRFDNNTYAAIGDEGFAYSSTHAPILDGSLRNEFRSYKRQADIVEIESNVVERYIRKVIMTSESKKQLLSFLPEAVHSACNGIKDKHFDTPNKCVSVITNENKTKHINIIKMRFTLSLLEIAA
jgi:hypothetical protein|tara:strand:+ start:551 stop:1072 length:522 start_codon:yes stop_codon:yes gene_type:complete